MFFSLHTVSPICSLWLWGKKEKRASEEKLFFYTSWITPPQNNVRSEWESLINNFFLLKSQISRPATLTRSSCAMLECSTVLDSLLMFMGEVPAIFINFTPPDFHNCFLLPLFPLVSQITMYVSAFRISYICRSIEKLHTAISPWILHIFINLDSLWLSTVNTFVENWVQIADSGGKVL